MRCRRLAQQNLLLNAIFVESFMCEDLIMSPYVTAGIITMYSWRSDDRFDCYWPKLSSNPNITMGMFLKILQIYTAQVTKFEEKNDKIKFVLGKNTMITVDDIAGAGLLIDYARSLPAITLPQWQRYGKTAGIIFDELQLKGNITDADVIKNSQLGWKYDLLILNQNISPQLCWKMRRIDRGRFDCSEIRRFCQDPFTKQLCQDVYVHMYKECGTMPQRVVDAASELFDVDIIIMNIPLQWNWNIINAREDIPVTYKLANEYQLDGSFMIYKWNYFDMNKVLIKPDVSMAEIIAAELKYERGEFTQEMLADGNYNATKIVKSPIYDWRKFPAYFVYRDDVPPHLYGGIFLKYSHRFEDEILKDTQNDL